MTSVAAAAEAYYDRLADAQAEEHELQCYLDERGITYEEYVAERRADEADAAEDRAYWSAR